MASAAMASLVFSQAAARLRVTTPNTVRSASKAASTSAESSAGSTYTMDWRL